MLFHVWLQIIVRSGSNQTFLSFLWRSCFPTLDRPQTPCHCPVLFADLLVSSPSSPAPSQNGPRTVFLPDEEVFAWPGLAAPSQPPQTRYPFCQQAPPKRLDLWLLLLPAEARARGEPFGELPTHLVPVKPVWRNLASLYSTCISEEGTRYFFLSPLPLVHYSKIVLLLRAGPQLSKIWLSAIPLTLFFP